GLLVQAQGLRLPGFTGASRLFDGLADTSFDIVHVYLLRLMVDDGCHRINESDFATEERHDLAQFGVFPHVTVVPGLYGLRGRLVSGPGFSCRSGSRGATPLSCVPVALDGDPSFPTTRMMLVSCLSSSIFSRDVSTDLLPCPPRRASHQTQ